MPVLFPVLSLCNIPADEHRSWDALTTQAGLNAMLSQNIEAKNRSVGRGIKGHLLLPPPHAMQESQLIWLNVNMQSVQVSGDELLAFPAPDSSFPDFGRIWCF